MNTKYAVMSDFHSFDITAITTVIQILKDEGIDALVLNGDVFGDRSGYDQQRYFATLLDAVGKSGLETYVLPGSHEVVHVFEPLLDHFVTKYGNIVNTLKDPRVDRAGHHIVFLYGSDWRAGDAIQHGYSLENHNPSGVYSNHGAYLRVLNMNDLAKLMSDPAKTIVFSHVPRKFDKPEVAVDMAEFWETHRQFKMGNQVIEVGSIFPGPVGYSLKNQGAPILLKRENRGNEELRKIFDQLGITKNITGHFHESAGRANDLNGEEVQKGNYVSDLFYNASCMDRGILGIVVVNDAKIAFFPKAFIFN